MGSVLIVDVPASEAARAIVAPVVLETELNACPFDAHKLSCIATAVIEEYCGRVFGVQGYTEYLAGTGDQELRLEISPITEVVSVDGDDVPDYVLDSRRGILFAPDDVWARRYRYYDYVNCMPMAGSGAARDFVVNYLAGYTTMPADLVNVAVEIARTAMNENALDRSMKAAALGDYNYTRDWSGALYKGGLVSGHEATLDKYKVMAVC